MIFNLFSSEPLHPLADAKELKRVLGELPVDNDFKAINEVVAWLESLENADKLRADKLNEIVRQLDEAAQAAMRRLARQYLTAPRLSKAEERRFWAIATEFWSRLANLYEMALAAGTAKDKAADGLKSRLPLIASRLIHALSSQLKWTYFNYGPIDHELWRRLGAAYLFAEQHKFSGKALQLYPGLPGATTAALEYLKPLVLSASALDSLLPLEMELAEKVIGNFLPHFVLTSAGRHDNLYWIDPAGDQPPQRLARQPPASSTKRYLAPGGAPAELAETIRVVERGEVPAELALGGQYSAEQVLHVLHHIANYWAEKPPVRRHQRHSVKTRLFVMHGFDSCSSILNGAGATLGDSAESWVVDNVSMGGFGAVVALQREDWLRIGVLLCVQPEGGDNWLLGVVRRYGKESEMVADVGIETMAKRAATVDLRRRGGGASYSVAGAGIRGIAFMDVADSDEFHVVLPTDTFDLRDSLEAQIDGRVTLLSPVELLTTGPDYQVGRYRARYAQSQ